MGKKSRNKETISIQELINSPQQMHNLGALVVPSDQCGLRVHTAFAKINSSN